MYILSLNRQVFADIYLLNVCKVYATVFVLRINNFMSYIRWSVLPSVTSASLWLRDFVLPEGTGVSQASASGSLLHRTFWTVWERSTLLSRAVKQLTRLLVQAAIQVNTVGLTVCHCYSHGMVCYIATWVRFVIRPEKQSNSYSKSLLTSYCDDVYLH